MDDGEPVTADDIKSAVSADMVDGVASFSDGTNQVTQMDPQKRLDVADRLSRSQAAQNTNFGLRTVALKGGGAW